MIAEKIKTENLGLWILFETNGYGLTSKNLDFLKSCGVDAFWLDIKAWDKEIHKKLTGCENTWILRLPEEILILFTILAFFGEYKLKEVRSPTLKEMLEAYHAVKEAGLKNVRLGNIGVFVSTQQELELLLETAKEAI